MEDLPKQYNPDLTEEKWYAFWQQKGCFHADPSSGKPPYCLVMPPPNVTGVLHMGHALVNTLQDIVVRWRRMMGDEVLWVPGLDHAGISTQTVVEKDLIAKEGKRRTDLDRDQFLARVWKWKEERSGQIVDQLKRLGCSCDWMRERFTMDEDASLAVRTLFKKLFDDGLIYRGDYLVNWDPVTQTALADDEVEYEEKEGHLWYFNYPFKEGEGHITIATTRPETMLGDVAVAVSPRDERYRAVIGKKVLLPIVNRELPIIADQAVDPEFGTGAVKITPAHDPNDYEIGCRHHLPMINILHPDATLNENGLEYEGLSVEEARSHIVARIKEIGFLEKTESHHHRVGVSYRSKAIIQPFLSKQWFIRMAPFKDKLIAAVKEGKVRMIPKNWESTYFHWIENLRDWCISRQLWWGHRIPIWYHRDDPNRILCYAKTGRPPEVIKDPASWRQDDDVLDTWFSSALWPFSALGWPHKTRELNLFYPNATLITGHDILFFWVARMIMMGEYAMGEVPFKETVLQGLIYGKSYFRKEPNGGVTYASAEEKKQYDLGNTPPAGIHAKWEKMSKSKGNVIDPIEIIDLYGADAMRMALTASATQSRQIDLDRRRFEEFRNFANKIWNGARFVLINMTLSSEELMTGIDFSLLTLEDKWMLSSLNRVIQKMERYLSESTFDRFAMQSYTFFWDEFCADYVEIAKPLLSKKIGTEDERLNKQKLLITVLVQALLLMHPVAPFITEEVFSQIKTRFPKLRAATPDRYTEVTVRALRSVACAVAPYPTVICETAIDQTVEQQFQTIKSIAHAVRQIRAEMQLPRHIASDLIIRGDNDDALNLITKQSNLLKALVPLYNITANPAKDPTGFTSSTYVNGVKLILPLPTELEAKEKRRLAKEQTKVEQAIVALEQQLANEDFVANAPKDIVSKQRLKLSELKTKLSDIAAKSSR
ncbi:MAG: valine--tRNA ligase [Chlamydiota bacterium]